MGKAKTTTEAAAASAAGLWVVRRHKVCRWCPSEQRHRILYRSRYLKGPADKPLGGRIVRGVTG